MTMTPVKTAQTTPGLVYLIQAVGTNRYKIGYTTQEINIRLSQLQTKNQAFELTVVCVVNSSDAKLLKSKIHKFYYRNQIRFEWFEFEDRNQVIATMNLVNKDITKDIAKSCSNILEGITQSNKELDNFPIEKFDVLNTKPSLSHVIECSIRSIYNYSEIAEIYVDDFLNDYPNVNNKRITSYPLTIYQCWVLFRISQFLKTVPKSEVLKFQLENNPAIQAQYSKAQFNSIYPEYTQGMYHDILCN